MDEHRIRPEDIRIVEDGGVTFNVGGIEPLGGETVIHLESHGQWIKALWHRSGWEGSIFDPELKQIQVSLARPAAKLFEE